MHRGVVYILAKEARGGAVKTRLCPPLDEAQSALLALAFAEDTLARLAGLREAARLDVRLALDDGDANADLPRGGGVRGVADRLGLLVEGQGGGDLGARMARLVERGAEGGLPTMLVGTDSPDLPPEMLRAAARALARVDVVVAPAQDGGYVLVGARRPVPALFEIDAPWSGPQVFEATCRALRRAGCSYEALPAWDDVDDAAALARLARRLEEGGGAAAPATARLLAEWKREGVRF
jgi:rSAM/selenodomain-associated transferase 1